VLGFWTQSLAGAQYFPINSWIPASFIKSPVFYLTHPLQDWHNVEGSEFQHLILNPTIQCTIPSSDPLRDKGDSSGPQCHLLARRSCCGALCSVLCRSSSHFTGNRVWALAHYLWLRTFQGGNPLRGTETQPLTSTTAFQWNLLDAWLLMRLAWEWRTIWTETGLSDDAHDGGLSWGCRILIACEEGNKFDPR
jgi:hypothetical protein